MATLFPETKDTFVDTFRFSKAAFIYASKESTLVDDDFQFKVKRGLQLVGVLDEIKPLTALTGSKKTGLVLSALFGNTVEISVEMPDTHLRLSDSVICDPFRIAVELLPNPALQLIFGMDVLVPKQKEPLHFDLMLEIGIADARGSGTMKGYWVNPFGLNGLQIGPALALQVGIIYAQFVQTGLPSEFGFVGGIVLGDVSGQMGANIPVNPMNLILMGEVEKLSPQNLVKFANTLTGLSLNPDVIPDFYHLETLKLYCAPIGGNIGTVAYEPGFSFIADLVLFKKRINIYTVFNEEGVIAKGEIDKIDIGPLVLRGAHGDNAKLDLALTSEKQAVYIDGFFDFLGTGTHIYVDISNKGAHFDFELKFVNMLKFTIQADTSGSLDKPETLDFAMYAAFENDLTDYIKTMLVQKINDAQITANTSIRDAQKKVKEAEKAYLALFNPVKAELDKAQADADAYLAKCVKEVNDQKALWTKSVDTAKANVANARQIYENAMADARKKVIDAQNSYNAAMQEAQNKVNAAQVTYNNAFNKAQADMDRALANYNASYGKAYSDLRNAQNTVNKLQNDINHYQRIINNLKWYEKAAAIYYGSIVAGLWVSMKTAQGALAAAQAIVNGFQTSSTAVALTTARATLNAVQTGGVAIALQGARQALEALRYGAGYIAWQTAQQTLNGLQFGAQYIAWQNVNNALFAAQTTGRKLLDTAEFTLANVGTSTVYITLQAAKYSLEIIQQGSAAIAFESAKAALEGIRLGVADMLQLSAYIAAHIGDIVEVKEVTLAASFKGLQKGDLFKATFKGAVLNQNYDFILDFDVQDVVSFMDKLFKNVLDEAKNIAKAVKPK